MDPYSSGINDIETPAGLDFNLDAWVASGPKDYTPDSSRHAASPRSPVDGTSSTDQRIFGTQHAKTPVDDDTQPSWAELKTKAGRDRKRLPLACIVCRRKKIRCSGEKPTCKHCAKGRLPCVYKITARKAAPRTDYMSMLDKRLKRMEDRVIKIIPKDEARHLTQVPRAVVRPKAQPDDEKSLGQKRNADEAFGSELDKWSDPLPSRKLPISSTADHLFEDTDGVLMTEGMDLLPCLELQNHLAEVYFDYVYGQSYHLLHKPTYMRDLTSGTIPPVLSLAVCALSARFSDHPQLQTEPPFLRGEMWANAALDIALRRFDTPNITVVIVFLLLGLHSFGTCQGGRSWMVSGMAHRMAYALQLHKDPEHEMSGPGSDKKTELSFMDRELRRRVMWACFMMDRFTSSGTERPMFANEHYFRLQLPVRENYYQLEVPALTEDLHGNLPKDAKTDDEDKAHKEVRSNMGVAAYNIRLVAIWGRLVQYLNLGGRQRDQYPIWSPQSGYHPLFHQVTEFKTNLPEGLRHTSENLELYSSEGIANQFLFMHITYNLIILFLNRFAFPGIASCPPCENIPNNFVANGRKAAIEAATTISKLIEQAADCRLVAPLSAYAAYLSSAVHIYCIFSQHSGLEASSKRFLTSNIKYLTKMKKYWGMFQFLTENLKDLYRQHADAASKGRRVIITGKTPSMIYQYSDWVERFPRGVTGTGEPRPKGGKKIEITKKSNLQTVEQFFTSLSASTTTPQKQPKGRKRGTKKHQTKADEEVQPSTHDELSPQINTFEADGIAYMDPYIQVQPVLPNVPDLDGFPDAETTAFSQPLNSHFSPDGSFNSSTPVIGMNNNLWEFDMGNFGDDLFSNNPSGAWFLPFNMDMPGVENNANGGLPTSSTPGFQGLWS